MTIEVMRYKLNELRMMLNDGEHTEEQGILTDIIKELDRVENKGEFDGMNNGEVMNLVLRKTFPRTIFIRGIDEYNKTKSIVYSEEWENAPYKGESEGEERAERQ